MYIASDWKDYECIDCGEGMKYERWGGIHLLRPDPQVIWGYSGGKSALFEGAVTAAP